jgi:hypothetical protein
MLKVLSAIGFASALVLAPAMALADDAAAPAGAAPAAAPDAAAAAPMAHHHHHHHHHHRGHPVKHDMSHPGDAPAGDAPK